MKKGIVVGLLFLIPLLGGALIGFSVGHSSCRSQDGAAAVEDLLQTSASRDSVNETVHASRQNAITRTVALASPAVVGINVIGEQVVRYRSPFGDDPFFSQFFGDNYYRQKVQELGSGFIISPDGYILTNDHVAGNGKEITVTMTNGEKKRAQLIGTDAVSDIALLKIDGSNLPYLRLGNSNDVIIGEWAIAFGNPFGLFDLGDKPTVTVGVVSATGMNLQAQEGRTYRGMIQTDAAINSGNSGGPLVNSDGEVIGVNAVIFTPNQGSIGLGFAIPINRVKEIVARLKKSGKVEREFWTGLEIQSVDNNLARYFGLRKAEGVIVSGVQRGSPGERAGFRAGDVIVDVGGEKVLDEEQLMGIVSDAKVGDVLVMKIIREKKQLTLNLTLEKR